MTPFEFVAMMAHETLVSNSGLQCYWCRGRPAWDEHAPGPVQHSEKCPTMIAQEVLRDS